MLRRIRPIGRKPSSTKWISGITSFSGIVPVSCGGDHSVTLPIFRGIAKHRPVGMVHIDAHCDTGDDYLGSRFLARDDEIVDVEHGHILSSGDDVVVGVVVPG